MSSGLVLLSIVSQLSVNAQPVKTDTADPQYRYTAFSEQFSDDRSLAMRRNFRKHLEKVAYGATTDQVLSLLGEPDEIRPDGDRKSMIWCYGVAGPDALPTLGQIGFSDEGRVKWIAGVLLRFHPISKIILKQLDATPPSGVITESELRDLLCLFDQYCEDMGRYGDGTMDAKAFDPLSFIRDVNALLPYGKDKILAAASEYALISSCMPDSLNLILGCLFEIPEHSDYLTEASPHLLWSATYIAPEPEDALRVPRYPLAIVDDIPVMICEVGNFSGFYRVQYVSPYVAYLKSQGRLRSHSLRPINTPFEVMDKLYNSPQWLWGRTYQSHYGVHVGTASEEKHGKQLVMQQLMRLTRNVVPHPEFYSYWASNESQHLTEDIWQGIDAEFTRLNCRWDELAQNYVRADVSAPNIAPTRQ